jgi:hypothetical protein
MHASSICAVPLRDFSDTKNMKRIMQPFSVFELTFLKDEIYVHDTHYNILGT